MTTQRVMWTAESIGGSLNTCAILLPLCFFDRRLNSANGKRYANVDIHYLFRAFLMHGVYIN